MNVLPAIEKALQTLDPADVNLICLAVLHGVPVRDLSPPGQPQEALQTRLIGALKKLRQALNDQGLTIKALRSAG